MKRNNKYPPKAVEINFTEKLPEPKQRSSRLIDREKLPVVIKSRIQVENILSVHHKKDNFKELSKLDKVGKEVLKKIILEPSNFDYVIRRDAISALSNFKDVDSVLLLSSIINDKKEDEVNIGRAIDSLVEIGGKDSYNMLIKLYKNPRSLYIKNRVLKRILKCKDECFIPILKDAILNNSSDRLKKKAHEMLLDLGVKSDKPKYSKIIDKEKRIVREK